MISFDQDATAEGFSSQSELDRWLDTLAELHEIESSGVAELHAPIVRPKRLRDVASPDWIADVLRDCRPLLTVEEAISLLRMSRRNFYRLIARGRIASKRAAESGSSRLLIPRASLERYLKSL